jgi:hypothetical protein
MLNQFAKLLLSATALAPVAIVVGVNKLSNQCSFLEWFSWIALAFFLMIVCILMLSLIKQKGEVETKQIKSIKNADQEVVAFLITYLLPLFRESKLTFTGDVLTSIVVFAIIFIAVVNSNAYHFNPLLGLFGYHFFEITTEEDMSFILISRRNIRKAKLTLRTIEVTDYIFMDKGEQNA